MKNKLKKLIDEMYVQIDHKTRTKANKLADKGEMDFNMFWNELSLETKYKFKKWYEKNMKQDFVEFEQDDVVCQVFSELLG